MLCPNCHAYVPSDAVRCPRCGMPVNLPDDGEKQEDRETFGGPPAGAAAA